MIDRTADFFELGGDSVSAIGIANNMAKEGFDLAPQDLFEHHTVAGLAAALTARYGTGGLASAPADVENPPVPPNISYFLERGLREVGRWCVPIILKISADVSLDDVRAVLTAVANHHDALRLRVVERARAWEQRVAAPQEFTELSTQSLPPDVARGSRDEREAAMSILAELVNSRDYQYTPIAATYITGAQDDPRYLVVTVHHLAGDNASREIVMTDIFTAFSQRIAGDAITLQPVTTSWLDWSQRCAALSTHPAVLDSREFWLEGAERATLQIGKPEITGAPHDDDLVTVSSVLSGELTADVDEAQRTLRLPADEILLAALGRTIAHALGEGVVAVDVAGHGRSVLKPDVDLHRTVGWFTTIYPIPLDCFTAATSSAMELINGVHRTIEAVPHHGIGHGLLRYVYAPTARQLGAVPHADVFFSYLGVIADLPAFEGPVQLDMDAAMPAREMLPGLGHALELRVYRTGGLLHLDWWFDTRRLQRAEVKKLSAQFPMSLADLTREAIAAAEQEGEIAIDTEESVLVDLSALDG